MDLKEKFLEIISRDEVIALATSVDNIPNVRILNYVYMENEKFLYFTSIQGDPKEKEFIANKNAAFTTIPKDEASYIRVHFAAVKKSAKTISDVQDLFINRWAWFKDLIDHDGDKRDVYEIHFSKVTVYPDPDNGFEIDL